MIAKTILGAVIGGVIGFGIYRFIGCASGACPINIQPLGEHDHGHGHWGLGNQTGLI